MYSFVNMCHVSFLFPSPAVVMIVCAFSITPFMGLPFIYAIHSVVVSFHVQHHGEHQIYSDQYVLFSVHYKYVDE